MDSVDYEPLPTLDEDAEKGISEEPFLKLNERFQGGFKYKDKPFLIAFVAHIGVVLFIFVKESVQAHACKCLTRSALPWLLILCGLCLLSFITGAIILFTLNRFLKIFVVTVMIASCFLPLIIASAAIASGHWAASIPALTSSGLAVVFFHLIRSRIDFATAVLSVVVSCLRDNHNLLLVAMFGIIPQALWTLLIGVTLYATVLTKSLEPAAISWLQCIFLFISLFWTFQVIRNVVHVTTAGTVAAWFFFPDNSRPQASVRDSLKKSVTVSLGSICFGSLLIAIVQLVRLFVYHARKQRRYQTLTRIAQWIAVLVEGVMIYFNKYALVYVAVYGTPFVQSAKNMGHMIQSRGLSAVVNDDITGTVLTFICVLNSLLVSSIAMMLASLFGSSLSSSTFTASFWVGYCITGVVTSVVESGVATIFVCFMEESNALKASHIDAYNSLASAWMVVYGGQFKEPISMSRP